MLTNRIKVLSFHTASARSGHTAQTKTTPAGVAFRYALYSYDFFLLAIPIKPIRPEPKSQTAGGNGITTGDSV